MKKYPKVILRKDDSPIDGRLPLRPVTPTKFGAWLSSPAGVIGALVFVALAVLSVPALMVAVFTALPRSDAGEVRASYLTELKHAFLGDRYILSMACPSEAGTYRTRVAASGYGDAHRVAGVWWPMCSLSSAKPIGEGRWGSEPYEIELECPANWERKTIRLSAMSLDEAVARGAPQRPECEVRSAWRDCGRRSLFCGKDSKQFKPQRLP